MDDGHYEAARVKGKGVWQRHTQRKKDGWLGDELRAVRVHGQEKKDEGERD